VVVGAGAIGLELGSVWRRLGSQVTFIEILSKVAPFADSQISTLLERSLKAQGMAFKLNTRVKGARVTGDGVTVSVEDQKGAAAEIGCDKILVAVGRKPCTVESGLEEAGVELDEKGRVRVDGSFKTNVPGVYAIGDLIQGPMLAHKASEEGVAAVKSSRASPATSTMAPFRTSSTRGPSSRRWESLKRRRRRRASRTRSESSTSKATAARRAWGRKRVS